MRDLLWIISASPESMLYSITLPIMEWNFNTTAAVINRASLIFIHDIAPGLTRENIIEIKNMILPHCASQNVPSHSASTRNQTDGRQQTDNTIWKARDKQTTVQQNRRTAGLLASYCSDCPCFLNLRGLLNIWCKFWQENTENILTLMAMLPGWC